MSDLLNGPGQPCRCEGACSSPSTYALNLPPRPVYQPAPPDGLSMRDVAAWERANLLRWWVDHRRRLWAELGLTRPAATNLGDTLATARSNVVQPVLRAKKTLNDAARALAPLRRAPLTTPSGDDPE